MGFGVEQFEDIDLPVSVVALIDDFALLDRVLVLLLSSHLLEFVHVVSEVFGELMGVVLCVKDGVVDILLRDFPPGMLKEMAGNALDFLELQQGEVTVPNVLTEMGNHGVHNS